MSNKIINIGIPAYNEQNTIAFLLEDLLSQKLVKVKIGRLLVVSDNSTDKTNEIVKCYPHPKVSLKINKNRKGQALSQNEIINSLKNDDLLILNADVRIKDKNFIENIVSFQQQNQADIVSPKFEPLAPRNFFESILYYSRKYKHEMFVKHHDGDNLFMCGGGARLFSRKILQRFSWPNIVTEDVYSYFYCIKNGYKFKYFNNGIVYFRLPDNFRDYLRQSKRYSIGALELQQIFSPYWVKAKYQIEPYNFMLFLGKFALMKPVHFMGYLVVHLSTRIFSNKNYFNPLWKIAGSSKEI